MELAIESPSEPDPEPSSQERWVDRINPHKGSVASRTRTMTVDDALAAAESAAAAFPGWATTSPVERRKRLLAAADGLEAATRDLVQTMIDETGATLGWSHFNVLEAARMLREAASMTTQITGETIPSNVPGNLAMSVRSPAGVVLGIAPWNAPIILGVRAIAMPLACGNTVLLKASELCPSLHLQIGSVLHAAGLGDGIVSVITNRHGDAQAIVAALIKHPSVRRINFTGSTRVGKIVAELAARELKPALLELGGKAPLVVLADADLDAAVDAAAFGAFMNQGQICMSTERIVVLDAVAEAFVAKLAAKAASLKVGDPSDPKTVLGSLVGPETVPRVAGLMNDAVEKGARIVAGGEGKGCSMSATVVDHVDKTMQIYAQETFAPIVAVIRVGDVEEAIKVANDTEYGLSASVFGSDLGQAMRVAQRLETGICHINGPTVHDESQMPFGGVKASGYGRFGGKAGIAEFTDLRWLTIQAGPRHYPF